MTKLEQLKNIKLLFGMKTELVRCKVDMGAEVEVREQVEKENVGRWELINAGES